MYTALLWTLLHNVTKYLDHLWFNGVVHVFIPFIEIMVYDIIKLIYL